jgi:hypothetical protein
MSKISFKKYYSKNIGDIERASDAITALLELNYAPSEVKESSPADKGADLGAELAAADAAPESPAEEEVPEEEVNV